MMGIDETMRLINALEAMDIRTVLDVDYAAVKAELIDLDPKEALQLTDRICHLILDFMSSIGTISALKLLSKLK